MSSLIKETGRDRYFAARERELAALIDPATGVVSDRFARRVPCPNCGSHAHSRLFGKRGFTFVRCDECRLVFSNPQVDESLVLEEYRAGGSNDLWVDVLTSERQLDLDRAKFGEILDELEPFRGRGRLLDIGCSIGLFLALACERDWDGSGIEFGARALAYARDVFDVHVISTPLEECSFEDASLDVVTILSVLEHTTEPRRMLRECARILRPGGVLYAIVPNVNSLACRILHEHAATFDGRNHLIYFAPSTLADMLRREGFVPQRIRTRVSSLDPVLEWLTYNEPYSDAEMGGDPVVDWLRAPEQQTAFATAMDRLDLGYKMHALAVRAEG
jgi:2-polyprenyl-3-methyl-5-hydroxy-6-metoxy-1,4-benzoquinol methylase